MLIFLSICAAPSTRVLCTCVCLCVHVVFESHLAVHWVPHVFFKLIIYCSLSELFFSVVHKKLLYYWYCIYFFSSVSMVGLSPMMFFLILRVFTFIFQCVARVLFCIETHFVLLLILSLIFCLWLFWIFRAHSSCGTFHLCIHHFLSVYFPGLVTFV